MNLKRGVKRLAVRSVSSPLGSHTLISKEILRVLNFDYGPLEGSSRGGPQGAVSCMSIDFDVTTHSRFEDNRKGTLALLELADKYKIPITWAICGKSAEDDLKSFSAILDSSTPHEVGVHTYSHIDATACSSEQFKADIRRCIQALGLDSPRTFVFPWNREAHFDVLREMGFRTFRGKNRAIGGPVKKEGLWNIRPVYYVDQKSEGAEALISDYIDLSIRRSTIFHLWSHPWSLVKNGKTEPMMETLEPVFAHIAEKREQKALVTSTMGEIGASLDMAAGLPGSPRETVQHHLQGISA